MLAAVSVSVTPVLVWADDEQTYTVELVSQPLSESLKSFADQTGLQIVFFSEVADGVQAVPLNGNYTAEAALDTLLVDSGLTYEFINDKAVTVKPVRSAVAEDLSPGKFRPASNPVLMMAQNRISAAEDPSSETRRRGDNNGDDDVILIEEIVVTGSNIRGADPVGATQVVFTREDIGRTGFSTLGELFQSLPQNLDDISGDGSVATGASTVARGNTQGASGISLRGLGPGSTLTLINGKRRPGNILGQAVDVSSIPLSMIESIEVVTGARAAVYGSDAVAGVVNIRTRRSYDGAETQVYYGESGAGGERFNISQVFGRSFENGGFILSYDYLEDQSLDATAAGVVPETFPNGFMPVPGLWDIQRPSDQHVGIFAGHYNLSDDAKVYADASFSLRTNESNKARTRIGCCDFGSSVVTDSDQYSANVGFRFDVGSEWQVDLSGLHGTVDNVADIASPFALFPDRITNLDVAPTNRNFEETTLTSFSVVADGPLGKYAGGAISAAIGVEYRIEDLKSKNIRLPSEVRGGENTDREVGAVFAEVHVPMLNGSGQRLEATLAGRYDDYSDFGGTFNPQVGVEWEPVDGLTFRGDYGEAYRAPDLILKELIVSVSLIELPDPLDPTGLTVASVLIEQGGNPDLQPETAKTWTAGIDWQPTDTTTISLSYFNIEYDDRIDVPTANFFAVLQDEALFPGILTRNPTPEQVEVVLQRQEFFNNITAIPFDPATDDPFAILSNIVLFDGRRNNLARDSLDGLDLTASTVWETRTGDWSARINGTYYLDFDRTATATSPTFSQLNQPGRTIDLRLRGNIGWSRDAWNVNAFVNYVDSYEDTLAATPTKIDSWTTIDVTARFDASSIGESRFFRGVKVTLGINNLFDEDPPEMLSNNFGLGYDPTNANALGRFVSLRLSKAW